MAAVKHRIHFRGGSISTSVESVSVLAGFLDTLVI